VRLDEEYGDITNKKSKPDIARENINQKAVYWQFTTKKQGLS